jgi:hypothetical protein
MRLESISCSKISLTAMNLHGSMESAHAACREKKSCMCHYGLIGNQSFDKHEDGGGDHAYPLHINGVVTNFVVNDMALK